MSDFLLLFRDGQSEPVSQADMGDMFGRFVAWSESLKAQGKLRAVERLKHEGGNTVRKRGGRVTVDGPFAEGKELVFGLFVITADSYAAACEEAGRCPLLDVGGAVEVRETDAFPK